MKNSETNRERILTGDAKNCKEIYFIFLSSISEDPGGVTLVLPRGDPVLEIHCPLQISLENVY